MRYFLIALGLLVALLGLYLTNEYRGEPRGLIGPPVAVIGGLALVAGLATCDIVNSIRDPRRRDDVGRG